ncbi:MAG: response regulator, partial [Bacteroidota bacterium]|nr:response regulator [Bacteroidota bacterium]
EITKAESLKKKNKENYQILLVEDNFLNQKFAIATLSKAGYKVDLAENGKIALEKFQKKSYDLVLMDINLPLMDGLEATKKIRLYEKQKKLKPSKIAAITAYVLEHNKEQCLTAGIDKYLTKPFLPQELVALVEELL